VLNYVFYACILMLQGIDNFRGEISQMGEILGFKFLKRRIFIKVILKKIKKFSPHIKLKKINVTSLGTYFIGRKSVQRGFALPIPWLNIQFAWNF
jgi:hypothetical protein